MPISNRLSPAHLASVAAVPFGNFGNPASLHTCRALTLQLPALHTVTNVSNPSVLVEPGCNRKTPGCGIF